MRLFVIAALALFLMAPLASAGPIGVAASGTARGDYVAVGLEEARCFKTWCVAIGGEEARCDGNPCVAWSPPTVNPPAPETYAELLIGFALAAAGYAPAEVDYWLTNGETFVMTMPGFDGQRCLDAQIDCSAASARLIGVSSTCQANPLACPALPQSLIAHTDRCPPATPAPPETDPITGKPWTSQPVYSAQRSGDFLYSYVQSVTLPNSYGDPCVGSWRLENAVVGQAYGWVGLGGSAVLPWALLVDDHASNTLDGSPTVQGADAIVAAVHDIRRAAMGDIVNPTLDVWYDVWHDLCPFSGHQCSLPP